VGDGRLQPVKCNDEAKANQDKQIGHFVMPDIDPGCHHQQAGQHDQLRRVSQCIH